MADNPYNRLAPFIQEYLYKAGWSELRAIQVQASHAIFDEVGHVLITSSTASGKTEAAFLPVITELVNHPSNGIGVIYIGPLKALLNDQFQRLHDLLEQAAIPVQNWHGDVSHPKKQKFLEYAQGILQITPESLEVMLMQHEADLSRLFSDLRFVVIDEVHAFLGSDRGQQVICQIQRLARYQASPPRRIGLSATLGDPRQAMQWLASGTDLPVTLISDTANRREVMIGLEHFPKLPSKFERNLKRAQADEDTAQITALQRAEEESQAFIQHLYAMTRQENKTLVFTNARAETEEIAASLRALAEKDHRPDIYYIHHGSLSASARESAETAMKEADHPACVIATMTLELGIDLGQLDQVLQINATPSVASFVQRLGRSGRRGNPARIFFYDRETPPDQTAPLHKQLPWNLIETIAIIQLYLEEKWIEPADTHQLPFSLLYHQTMSIIAAHTELTPPALAEQVLTLAPFVSVTPEQFRQLLQHLLAIKHLERTETGTLIIGLEGAKIVNDHHFFATFKGEDVFRVSDASGEIGTVQAVPKQGQRFMLAGQTWQVLSVDHARRVITVEHSAGAANAMWFGGGGKVHSRVLQRMRQVLQEDDEYRYLHDHAKLRLTEARRIARQQHFTDTQLVPLGGKQYLMLPWHGTHTLETLIMILALRGINVGERMLPFYIEIGLPQLDINDARLAVEEIAAHAPTGHHLTATLSRASLEKDKYDEFIPDDLLRDAFIANHVDITGAIEAIRQMAAKTLP